ncbi:xin actin-binding repeat-containing protein 1-like [Electrophorus electricus]|uniref:xin actin-binding repeat-containing protein 1-like n=1 Tax=Electrophorus electricus TaxID=8005 RepID=UPI0015D078AB|nr:xin actin-binding repeat-containing protein 1-like [Electrophorus electricus]
MADVAQKDSEQHNGSDLKDDSAQPKAAPIPPSCPQHDSVPPPPAAPVRDTSTLYQQRQKSELRRLLKHTDPEMKGLGNLVEEEFADMSCDTAPDIVYQGEVHSRCMIFENGVYNTGGAHLKQAHLIEGSFQDGNLLERPLTCSQEEGPMAHSLSGSGETNKQLSSYSQLDMNSQKECKALAQEGNFRVNVKATRKMFEGQLYDTLKDNKEDAFPERAVEMGGVQKQKRDLETYQNDTVKRNSPINIIDIADITDQDASEVYLRISRAKEIFEKGSHDKENSSSASENTSTENETLKTNVKNRAQMFESMHPDKINLQSEAKSATRDEGISKSLASLYNFNVIHSHGNLIEATEAAHMKKVNYKIIQEKGPEIEHEETVMGSIKNILLQILARVNLNSLIGFLKEDNQGNVEVKNVEVPSHQLPFTVHQDKEYRTTNMVQVIEDLLGQDICPGKGVLIQENGLGSVDILVYTLFRQESFDSIAIDQEIEDKMESKEMKSLQSRNYIMPSPPPSTQDKASSLSRLDDNRSSNVKLFQSCIEKGNLDYLKSLQRHSSDEDLSVPAVEREQNVLIALGSHKIIKAKFTTNPGSSGSPVQHEKTVQQPLDDLPANQSDKLSSHTKNEKCITECENVKSDKILHGQGAKYMCNENPDNPVQAELKNIADNKSSNLQAAIVSLQQATKEAIALQQSIQEKQKDISPSKLTQEDTAVATENQEISADEKKGYSEAAECSETSEPEQQQKDREEAIKGSVQSALDSLAKSSFNINKGDFKAAMIYRNSGKPSAGKKKEIYMEMDVKQSGFMVAPSKESQACMFTPLPGQVIVEAKQGRAEACQGHLTKNPTACSPTAQQTHPQMAFHNSKKPLGLKPAISPKPDHLKTNTRSTTVTIPGCAANIRALNTTQAKLNSAPTPKQCHQQCTYLKPAQEDDSVKASQDKTDVDRSETDCVLFNEGEKDKQLSQGPITMGNPEGTEEDTRDTFGEGEGIVPYNRQNLHESPIGFQASLQNFGIKTGQATAPVKPKRIKMATSSAVQSPSLLQINTNDTKPHDSEHGGQSEINVKMREKKLRGESEAERRQRLSVHMDDIMRGNVSAAMEIFDKLRKQEELQNILSKVEEMEGKTSQEHVCDLRKIFQSVPDWAASHEHIKSNNVVEKKKVGRYVTVCDSEMLSSMEVAFGDLEKASAAIINLKEQTLSRLMDIEETVKKALYSVSTLKSDSDIAGLSGLFKESMMAGHRLPISGNIRKISIGSSRSSKAQNVNNLEVLRKTAAEEPVILEERSKPQCSIPTPKPTAGSPSSPSFICIQSAARKNNESQGLQKPPSSVQNSNAKAETFQSMTCYNMPTDLKLCSDTKGTSCSSANNRRQISTLEVQTIPEEETVIGTKTIREKYEETDGFGNKFYSSKTSTVVTTQPETKTCFRREVISSPAMSEMNTYPRINTPTFKRDQTSL